MSFCSRGSRQGQGRRRPHIWKEGANKRIRFTVHFDANSNEFNELTRTGHLFLSEQNLTQPMLPVPAPLQPHPGILEEPPMFNLNENKGWDVNPNPPNPPNPPYSGNIGGGAPDPNHQHVNASPSAAASVNLLSDPKENAKKSCSLQPVRPLDLKEKQPILDLKGKQPLSKSPSGMTEKPHQTPPVTVHSEANSFKEEKKDREDISHLDLFPEISSF